MVAAAPNIDFNTSPGGPRARLVSGALLIAGRSLERQGMFAPFGLALAAHDEIVSVAAYSGNAAPCAEELIALLQAGLAAGRRARRYLATTLVFESEIPLVCGGAAVRAIELRLCDEASASTLCFPHVRERGELRLQWPHWRGEVTSVTTVSAW